jgi:hypothetical protein
MRTMARDPADRPASSEATEITPDMIRAGVAEYQSWKYEEEEIEGLVAKIFFAMSNEARR